MPPNYYYDLEDTVERRVKNGAKWTFSSLRPPAIIGFSTGSTMNLMTCLAVYGTICRELGIAMKYESPILPSIGLSQKLVASLVWLAIAS